MSDNLQETIRESAKAPAKASGDAGSVEQVLVYRDRTFIVQVALGNRGRVKLGLQHREQQGRHTPGMA